MKIVVYVLSKAMGLGLPEFSRVQPLSLSLLEMSFDVKAEQGI